MKLVTIEEGQSYWKTTEKAQHFSEHYSLVDINSLLFLETPAPRL